MYSCTVKLKGLVKRTAVPSTFLEKHILQDHDQKQKSVTAVQLYSCTVVTQCYPPKCPPTATLYTAVRFLQYINCVHTVQKGCDGNYFSPPRACGLHAPKSSDAALEFARVPLCYRHLDSGTHKLLARATVKVAVVYLQSRELQRCISLEQRRQRLPIGAAGGSTRTHLGPALPTRIAVGRAMLRGRYRPESDSYSAPRANSRAR